MLTEVPGRVLDIGCGPGILRQELVNRGHRVLDLDLSLEMLKKARETLPDCPALGAKGDIRALPIKNNLFNTVVASGVLEYIPRPDNALDEIDRVLAPNGRVILTIPTPRPFYTVFLRAVSFLLRREVGATPYPHWLISPRTLKKQCENRGWIVIEEAWYHFIFFPLTDLFPRFSLLLGKKLERLWGRIPLFSRLGKGYVLKCLKPLK